MKASRSTTTMSHLTSVLTPTTSNHRSWQPATPCLTLPPAMCLHPGDPTLHICVQTTAASPTPRDPTGDAKHLEGHNIFEVLGEVLIDSGCVSDQEHCL